MRRLLLLLSVVLITVAIVVTLLRTRPHAQAVARPQTLPSLAITHAIPITHQAVESMSGRLFPDRQITLIANGSGRILTQSRNSGQAASQNTLLFQLDARSAQLALQRAQLQKQTAQDNQQQQAQQLAGLKRQEDLLQQRSKRLHTLHQSGHESTTAWENAQLQLLQNQQEQLRLHNAIHNSTQQQSQAELAIREAQNSLQNQRITAPFDGLLGRIFMPAGAWVQRGQSVAEWIDNSRLRLQLDLSPQQAQRLHLHQTLIMHHGTDQFSGELVALEPAPQSVALMQGAEIRFTPPTDSHLHPGMLLQVDLPYPLTGPLLGIPPSALQHRGNSRFVWRLKKDRIYQQMVTVGPQQGNLALIIHGLLAGQSLLSAPPSGLRDGQQIAVIPAP